MHRPSLSPIDATFPCIHASSHILFPLITSSDNCIYMRCTYIYIRVHDSYLYVYIAGSLASLDLFLLILPTCVCIARKKKGQVGIAKWPLSQERINWRCCCTFFSWSLPLLWLLQVYIIREYLKLICRLIYVSLTNESMFLDRVLDPSIPRMLLYRSWCRFSCCCSGTLAVDDRRSTGGNKCTSART